jgi:asparagine synthase (glutamine-hydrolysing)
MCGIFAILNNTTIPDDIIEDQFEKGRGRGPESSKLVSVNIKATFGFHRLAINGLNERSNQPFHIDDIQLICNGEIYNYKELYALMGITPTTDSDCEVIVHLYRKYGIAQTLQLLDGVFSFVLIDSQIHSNDSKIYIGRDPYGVRPLYWIENTTAIAFASEMKSLAGFIPHLSDIDGDNCRIRHFHPGHYVEYSLKFCVNPLWKRVTDPIIYHNPGFSNNAFVSTRFTEDVFQQIQKFFVAAVEKRCMTTERPIACLLSGGLDSSLVAALVQRFHKTRGLPSIETYSIGLAESEDLKYARMVAHHLGTVHTEVIIEEQDFIHAIPEVIEAIESYDTTTVRASIGNYLLGKYISQHSAAKVIFNGDGSDELLGGYLYMHKCPDPIEYDRECRRLLRDIHAFDVLRSDKSISSHGLEPRTPFLDRAWIQMYLSLPPAVRYTVFRRGSCEKELLRIAFSEKFWENDSPLLPKDATLLPDDILWRKKEAFSDGVSSHGRSLYQILQEFTNMVVGPLDAVASNIAKWAHNTPTTQEQYYYRSIFERIYPNQSHVVPYFWMPKYVDAKDASARTLDIYNTLDNNEK